MSYYNLGNWCPNAKSQDILNRAKAHIDSVEYAVSARWVFYRLLQDSLYSKKSDYQTFIALTSRARRAYWNGWNPLTLTDETREIHKAESKGERPADDIDEFVIGAIPEALEQAQNDLEYYKDKAENFSCEFNYSVDHWYLQSYFVAVAFEARAMLQQFRTYTKGLSLVPCGGQPSIPLRYETAQYVKDQADNYGLPPVICYFGDLDTAGENIFNSFAEDMMQWGGVEVIHCGLNEEQIQGFADSGNPVPENPDKPGQYQWEALTDGQAREIIGMTIKEYFDDEKIAEARDMSDEITEKVCDAVNENLELE